MTDWLPELGDDDLATLLEALEAWEVKDSGGDFMMDMFSEVITRDDPRARAAIADKVSEMKLKREREKTVRKERSVLLRAKLLTLRARRRVERTVQR